MYYTQYNHSSNYVILFYELVKPSQRGRSDSRLPVILNIVGGHDGLIHRVEYRSIHMHRDRITGQHL